MRITLVRHAEVQEEFLGKYNGHNDVGLSKKGCEQSLALAKTYENAGFDAVYCSDLLRSRETLKPFILQCEPVFAPELREKSWGVHEGKSFEEISAEGIEYVHFEQWINALDGERVEAFRERVREFFYEVVFQQKARNILVLTHSGVIKTFFSLVSDVSLEEAFGREAPYASSFVFEKKSDSLRLISTLFPPSSLLL